MGEFAKRISDGSEVKIGTCEEMLYLRFSDRGKVSALPGSVNINDDRVAGQLLFRLPFSDEDGILPGDYKEPFRRQRIYDANGDYTNPELETQPGIMQLHHPSGLLLNVPCYHGLRLPEVADGTRAFWNGKSWSIELAMLRCTQENGALVLHPVIGCRWCRKLWRTEWSKIWGYIPADMLTALSIECAERFANWPEVPAQTESADVA